MAKWLAGSSVEPSRVVLGSVYFGTEVTREQSLAVMDAYFEGGGNFIDTANGYAMWLPGGVGASELTIGEWIRSRGVRERVVLATKAAHPIDGKLIGNCARSNIEQQLSQSMERLGVARVDLFWLHRDEPTRPVGEITETLADIQRSGRIGSYGASNWEIRRFEAANAYAREHGLAPFVASQLPFSLGHVADGPKATEPVSDSRDALRQWHVKSGMPLVAYTSQASGYFGAENVAWAAGGFVGEPRRARDFDSPANRRRLLAAMELAKAKGCSANQIALSYLLNQRFPVYPIIGTGNPGHAREALGAVGIRLSEEEMAGLFA
ncbi:MAG: aldo/keto reductase [Armatimonadota bacterium]